MLTVCSDTKSKIAVAEAPCWELPTDEGMIIAIHRSSEADAASTLSPESDPWDALPTVSVALEGKFSPS